MSAFDTAVHTIQFLSADAVQKANSGHPGTPMALAGITVELFSSWLRYDPEEPNWPNRDRFVLSCGHASMLIYSALHLAGYDVSIQDLKDFRQWGSKTPGHPEFGHTPGVETTTGPLGQGVGNAVGMALASKLGGARTEGLLDYRVFALVSDGDLMEGVAAEAASIAGHLELDNLVVIYDDNKITIDGSTDQTFTEDVGKRFEAYGWHVQQVDGHAPDEVKAAVEKATTAKQPALIVARTHIGIGAPTKQDTAGAHGAPLGDDEIAGAKRSAGWPEDETFRIPEEAYSVFQDHVHKNQARRAAWEQRAAALSGKPATALASIVDGPPKESVLTALLEGVEPVKDATRSVAGKIQQKVAELVPTLVGGSADLAGSCKTTIKGAADLGPTDFSGRNIHFGVREHGMGAVMNGLALSGWFPFGSTFLIFSDYMRPSIRLAGLMNQQVAYVFTHDSVFLGEDGPTHQPIEQLWSLRLIPNLQVYRPADAFECAAAWAQAVARRDGPTAIVLSRQKLEPIERGDDFDPESMLDGGYVAREVASADVTLIASGSEVSAALAAADILAKEGKRARVVSMLCVEAFEALAVDKRETILGTAPRVSIELGRSGPWRGVVGAGGHCIGIDTFGVSAPAERIAEELGFTPEKLATRVAALL